MLICQCGGNLKIEGAVSGLLYIWYVLYCAKCNKYFFSSSHYIGNDKKYCMIEIEDME